MLARLGSFAAPARTEATTVMILSPPNLFQPDPHILGLNPPAPRNWPELLRAEPNIGKLISAARRTKRVGDRWRAYGRFKAELAKLVRHIAWDDAYDVAHRHLVTALGV